MILYSRIIGLLVGLCLVVVLLTYRSFETNFVFYLSWLSGLFIVFLFANTTVIKVKIDRVTVLVLAIVLAWLIVGLILSPFAYDKTEHFKILAITTFYMVTATFFSELLIKSKLNFAKYTFFMVNVWAIVNLILLALFFMGIYIPEKHQFSGVFHDRNVFSITTLLVVGFAVSHSESMTRGFSRVLLYISVIACFFMILISKSITGSLGLLILMFLYSQRLTLAKRIFTFSMLILVFVAVIATDNPLSARISRFIIAIMGDADSLNTNESAYLRVYLIKSGFELIAQNPWVGVGLNNAKEFVVWPDRGYGSFLHNTYLDVFTSGGFPLFLVYYGPIFYCLFSLLSFRKKVFKVLDERYYSLWKLAFVSLSLKLICDLTWTTYFEYFMVFTVIFSMYVTFYIKRALRMRHRALV